jgi:hypothetical protein
MMPDFDAYEFLRRFEVGELDSDLAQEIENLSAEQLEQLAFVLVGKLRRKAVGAI